MAIVFCQTWFMSQTVLCGLSLLLVHKAYGGHQQLLCKLYKNDITSSSGITHYLLQIVHLGVAKGWKIGVQLNAIVYFVAICVNFMRMICHHNCWAIISVKFKLQFNVEKLIQYTKHGWSGLLSKNYLCGSLLFAPRKFIPPRIVNKGNLLGATLICLDTWEPVVS